MAKRKTVEQVEEPLHCPECGSANLAYDETRGELVCQECGLVIDEGMIDQGPEWRAFDLEQGEKRARTGAPDLHDSRQGPLDHHRMEEQGLLRQDDPHQEPGPALPAPEVATADPRQQRDGAEPGLRP